MPQFLTKLAQMSVIGCILFYTIFCWHEEHMAHLEIHRQLLIPYYGLEFGNKGRLPNSDESWYNLDDYIETLKRHQEV